MPVLGDAADPIRRAVAVCQMGVKTSTLRTTLDSQATRRVNINAGPHPTTSRSIRTMSFSRSAMSASISSSGRGGWYL